MSLLGFFAEEYKRLYEYCPTGEGGGIDPTCSPHGDKIAGDARLKPQASQILSRHDSKVVSNLKRIRLYDGKQWNEAFKGQTMIPDTIAYTRLGLMTINTDYLNRGYKLQDVIDHEMGHVAFDASVQKSKWYRAHSDDKNFARFNTQAKRNADESFAETYKAYVQSRGKPPSKEYEKPFRVVRDILNSLK
jgi:hypothetical protein